MGKWNICHLLSKYPVDGGMKLLGISFIKLEDIPAAMRLKRLVPLPVKYVLEKGYKILDGNIVVDAPLNSKDNLSVDKEFFEYDKSSGPVVTAVSGADEILNYLEQKEKNDTLPWDEKGIKCWIKKLLKTLTVPDKGRVIHNRFGGDSIDCPPLVVALYDYLLALDTRTDLKPPDKESQARVICTYFCKEFPKIYMVLID